MATRLILTSAALLTFATVAFPADGVSNARAFSRVSGTITAAAAPGSSEESVRFRSGDAVLSGTLLRPSDGGRHPGVVLLHGSGPGPRAPLRPIASRFAADGYAALMFDKRGSGESTGSWVDASLDDLASDALAAAAFLKTQAGVDAAHVGTWGISQGGWVMARAIARDGDAFAFAVVVSGGGLKPIDVERSDYRAALDRAGVRDTAQRDPMVLVEKYLDYLRTGADRSGLERAIADARSNPWFPAVDVSRVLPSEGSRARWQWVADYDPATDLRRMLLPTLVVLGGRDRPELADQMERAWRDAFVAAGNRRATIVEFTGAGHGAVVEGAHHAGAAPQTFVPGYLEMVDAWLDALGRTF